MSTRTFCCQIHIQRLSFTTLPDIRELLERIRDRWPEHIEIETGNDNGEYVNAMIESDDPHATYGRIRRTFVDSKLPGSELAPASIITVTGDHGWKDYLLLHHFDTGQQLDSIEPIGK